MSPFAGRADFKEIDSFMRFQEKFRRFWIGRNGADQLYRFLVWVELALLVVSFVLNLIFHNLIVNLIFDGLILTLLALATFRLLSRNIYKRQKENKVYLKILSAIKNFFVLRKNRFRDRKTHIYRKCPKCKKVLRLPKIKGKHTVCCPCCRHRFDTNV